MIDSGAGPVLAGLPESLAGLATVATGPLYDGMEPECRSHAARILLRIINTASVPADVLHAEPALAAAMTALAAMLGSSHSLEVRRHTAAALAKLVAERPSRSAWSTEPPSDLPHVACIKGLLANPTSVVPIVTLCTASGSGPISAAKTAAVHTLQAICSYLSQTEHAQQP